MPTPSIQKFAQLVPVCQRTSELATLLDIFNGSRHDSIVVVSEHQYPVGVVKLRQIMPHLLSLAKVCSSGTTMTTGFLHKPLSWLEPNIIEPITILPGKLSLNQFWYYLQDHGSREGGLGELGSNWDREFNQFPIRDQEHWALVDGDQKFIGLLNSWLLLKSLASTFTQQRSESIVKRTQPKGLNPNPLRTHHPDYRLTAKSSWVNSLGLSSRINSGLKTQEEALTKTPQFKGINPLVQLLEQLPLPLSIQTSTGKVLAENLTWREQIETSSQGNPGNSSTTGTKNSTSAQKNPGAREKIPYRSSYNRLLSNHVPREVSKEGLKQSMEEPLTSLDFQWRQPDTQNSPTFHDQSAPTSPGQWPLSVGNVSDQGDKTSEQAALGQYCALDTPYQAATTIHERVLLFSSPVKKTRGNHTPCQETAAPTDPTLSNSQERVFSFVKIPLSPAIAALWEGGLETGSCEPKVAFDYSRSPISRSESPNSKLYLVLAQDTTEQRLFAQELAAKNADLVQLNRLKDEFLACISHELKTPITAILGLSTLLKDQALGELNQRQSRYAQLIYQSGRKLMAVVNDILDLTRMETGQLKLTVEPVQIRTVCDRAYDQARSEIDSKHSEDNNRDYPTKFTLEIEPGLEMLIADELRLRQMLVHLFSNALKFTDGSGEIGLKVNWWQGWIAFTVWDTGIGIPADKQHLIFQKFQQLEKPLTRSFEGTGLGLVLTQHLAHLHGGDVSFISKAGVGSQFTLLFPPCPPQASSDQLDNWDEQLSGIAPTATSHPPSSTPNRLVLIVEAVPRYLEGLTEQLKSLGYWVVVARSGTEAIEKARRLQPYAILLNPLLPKLSGWDVLTLLKSDAQTNHIPVLVTATQAEKQQATHNKADGFLSLPVQEEALRENLSRLAKDESNTSSVLTILYLNPGDGRKGYSVESYQNPDSSELTYELTSLLSLEHLDLNYRVLEADDFDQAELLSRVWNPDVIVLNGARLIDPFIYLNQFSSYPGLSSLPLVTLDHQTTEAANQVTGLSVYPCLAPNNQQKMAAILQVIQVAAGISCKPTILVMDTGEQRTKFRGNPLQVNRLNVESSDLSYGLSMAGKSSTSWLQALIQYLQTAGYCSLLACSWAEVYRQIQGKSVDLLLIRLTDLTNPSEHSKGLITLAQLPEQPPILVLDHRLDPKQHDPVIQSSNSSNLNSQLELLLEKIATQIVHWNSQSMTQLLKQIKQVMNPTL
ncbi:ATP-binding protein [Moorena sp. SIO3I6]|uniref:ATP-binding response regulator n=1 Tax=Moorena sp. SIO3I6 TaxID=2607831 RepID=UPI0013F9CB66|nr:ATP-binding protein [Moorena sp. SIO3I6]NEP20509.1 hybrid sensor histidine kinase/response regulator [Moorena sp. SIO3I6]